MPKPHLFIGVSIVVTGIIVAQEFPMSQTQPEKNSSATASARRRTAPALWLILALLVLATLFYTLMRSNSGQQQAAPTPPATPLAAITATDNPRSTPSAQAAVLSTTAQITLSPPAQSSPVASASVADATVRTESPLLFPLAAAQASQAPTPGEQLGAVPVYTYEVVNVYPHDHNAFTQGLVFDGDTLYEGTGLNGRSSLRRVDLATGEVLQQVDLKPEYFGEGIVVWEREIVQLTWQNQLGFVYDKASFTPQRTFSYPTEVWGIPHDGLRLIMSDGSAALYFWDAKSFKAVDSVDVYDINGPVTQLNELEYVNGEVFANVWQTDYIARIDPVSGQVLGWIDLSGLLPAEEQAGADVLNGIAYKPASDQLFVTGKLWPHLYEIRLKMRQ